MFRRFAAAAVVLLALPASTGAQETPPAEPDTTCQDRALLCPDLVMAPPSNMSLATSPGGKRVLRAENRIVNVGRGPMEVRARRGGYGTFPIATQVIRRVNGSEPLRRTDAGRVTFKFVDSYRGSYWKYQDAARFELWTLNAAGERTRMVRIGPKLAYCLRDLDRVKPNLVRTPRNRVYPACVQRRLVSQVRLGTSVGWADVYPARYPENWIDIGGLRGCFAFVHRADPGGSLAEEREDNNIGVRRISLPPRKGKVAPRGTCRTR